MSKFLFRYSRHFNSLSRDHSGIAIYERLHLSNPHFRVFSTDGSGETKPATASGGAYDDDKYPTGDFIFRQRTAWEDFLVRTRIFFALPWERIQKGSVLKIVLRGEVI